MANITVSRHIVDINGRIGITPLFESERKERASWIQADSETSVFVCSHLLKKTGSSANHSLGFHPHPKQALSRVILADNYAFNKTAIRKRWIRSEERRSQEYGD
ncbi:MAG: hypothetical protein ACHQT6_03520 [Candidatus Acidiferrales bacterium]